MKLSEIKIRDVPESLKNKVKKQAKAQGRSMNKQLIHILQETFKPKNGDGVSGDS